jgi:hypothetical protein
MVFTLFSGSENCPLVSTLSGDIVPHRRLCARIDLKRLVKTACSVRRWHRGFCLSDNDGDCCRGVEEVVAVVLFDIVVSGFVLGTCGNCC